MRKPGIVGASTVAAIALGAVLSVHAIDRAPLNVDEELTRRVAGGRFGAILSIIANQRGGGPLHFWLVHLTLQWPGGLAGLRVPSLVFFLLALPAIALIARELAGPVAAVGAVLLTACAPLAVTYATFGRPHTLLLAWISWGTVAALRAARTGDRRWWAAAGAILGTAIFSHPTAPIYELSAFAAALAYAPNVRRAWPGILTLALTTIPFEAATAHTLTHRYGVAAGARHGRTFDHKPVWQNALRFMAPHGRWLVVLALIGVATLLARRSYRALAAIAVVVVLPVLFFTYVPANGLSSLFFDRYVLPPLPLFLLLVAVGVTGVAQLAARYRPVVLLALLAAALAIELTTVHRHARNLAKLHGLTVDVPAPRYFLVRTPPLASRALVEAALKIRSAWVAAVPANPRAGDLVASDRQALEAPASCVSRGPLGDPDVSPNFPEVIT